MKTKVFAMALVFFTTITFAQNVDSTGYINTMTDNLMQKDGKLTIGGYAQIDYNQELNSDQYKNGKLDVHRLIMLLGYKFNERTSFVTELEFEHVKEVYVEQAFLNYTINDYMDFRAGLLLVPMGIINEYHEPPTFNGVERPDVDSKIAPTTWREIGFGLTGNVTSAQLKYQAYVVNGFNGYDGSAKLGGKNGLRKGRQKGAESYISSPNFTTKVEYYGIRGLNFGFSTYFGKTQSTLFDGLDKNNDAAKASADSSVVGIAMIGLDARYQYKGLQLKGQLYYNSLSNTDQYNDFTGEALGSSMIGYYAELGYNVLRATKADSELVPFVRYEQYNTQASMETGFTADDANNVNIITAGLGWKITPKAALKADMVFKKSAAASEATKIFNAGIAVMF